MATRDQIVQEYQKYFPGRDVSEEDIRNAEEKGIDVISSSFGQITGQPQQATDAQTTAAGQGQYADITTLGDVATAEADVYKQMEDITTGAGRFDTALEEAMTIKQQQEAPYMEAIGEERERLAGLSLKKYKDLDPDTALRLLSQDASNIQAQMDTYREQYDAYRTDVSDVLEQARQTWNDKLSALGIQVEFLDRRKQDLMAERDYQMQLAALASRGGGGGGGRGGGAAADEFSQKQTEQFYKDIAYMQDDLAGGRIDWGTAFNTIASKYQVPPEEYGTIDVLLNKTKWAQPGAYEQQRAERGSEALQQTYGETSYGDVLSYFE